ncbi:MAG: GTPase Era [Gammaproteobacteria bacterium]
MSSTRCGLVAIVGRPNVGKSTLLNHLLGQKISITSRKPQTTRHRILGVSTQGDVQAVYVDTPGLHRGEGRALNRVMNRAARSAIRDVDLVLMVVDRERWTEDDEQVLAEVRASGKPALLLLNKVDRLEDKAALLPRMAQLGESGFFGSVLPVSALRGHNLAALQEEIGRRLPEAPHLFPPDQITDRSERFLVAEIVREKLMRQLGAELPYANAVMIEEYSERERSTHIGAVILVEKDGQKAIVIGQGGERLKRIGQEARADIERLLGRKVMLRLWVKVRSGWADDERALASLGYREEH